MWPEKTQWQTNAKSYDFLCPNCKAQRRWPFARIAAGKILLFQVGITALLCAALTYPWLNGKGIVVFIPIWLVAETIQRIRRRMVSQCPHCGFDPFLFVTDQDKAIQEIELHWKREFEKRGKPYPGMKRDRGKAPPL